MRNDSPRQRFEDEEQLARMEAKSCRCSKVCPLQGEDSRLSALNLGEESLVRWGSRSLIAQCGEKQDALQLTYFSGMCGS